jgi:hypothetical protein
MALGHIHFLNILGAVYRRQNRAEDALEVHQKVFDLTYAMADQLSDSPRISIAEMNLAASLAANKEWLAAKPHIDKVVDYFRNQSSDNNVYIGNYLRVRGGIFIGLNNFSQAESNSFESLTRCHSS